MRAEQNDAKRAVEEALALAEALEQSDAADAKQAAEEALALANASDAKPC